MSCSDEIRMVVNSAFLNQHQLANSYFSFFSFFLSKVRKMCELAAACIWNWSLYPPKLCKLVKTPHGRSWLIHGLRADLPPTRASSPTAQLRLRQLGLAQPSVLVRVCKMPLPSSVHPQHILPVNRLSPSTCCPLCCSLGLGVMLCLVVKGKATLIAAEDSGTCQSRNW